ncbi:MocR-like pyridoxine biosynthesis transcription factor PdxR [Microlunatus parietis]|uniref:GntR family transcriptional regulator/MocR family aminotransferase n=1 Tax=Microlunatus parietis TaxID=682979 RepID=A0A7Y9I7D8_9ACTN|nr:PLP-dependent aminotransferase family protein [Microlunatus parietis]NYE71649.1 GntR family transcriptional regulator/MocR family aminotransferase [Microlunatus parietis]
MSDSAIRPEDLVLLLGARPRRGVRAWLYRGIAKAVRDGRLPPGLRLPSSRAVAAALGVARGPVSEALELLAAEGYVITRDRSGSRVAPRAESVRAERPEVALRPPPSPGTPDPALFPWASWLRSMRIGSARLRPDDLGYGDPRGLPALRERVAELLRLTRGAVVAPDQVVIISGVAQGLTLLATVLRRRGAGPIGLEDPGSPGARDSLRSLGADVVPVPADGDGLDIDRRVGEPGAVLVTPAHQYPLGVPLSPDRRRRLLDWAAAVDRLVIEDDYDADLRYDGLPIGVLQAMAPDRVALLGSVSKVLAPGMRLGWLVPPPHLYDELVAAKRNADLGTSVFDQAALAEFIGSGEYQRQVRRLRQVYGERRAALVGGLRERFDVSPAGFSAGLHVLVRLPDHDAEQRALAYLAERNVAAHALSDCFFADGDPGLVLGTARIPAPDLIPALPD